MLSSRGLHAPPFAVSPSSPPPPNLGIHRRSRKGGSSPLPHANGGSNRENRTKTGQRTTCAVKETVPSLDGVVNGVGANGIVDFPQAEANDRHVVAAVKLHSG